ncbi:hypothetical protein GCM10019016_082620 [Streptomyces prasinosporus]|uniref:Uncharacterized protein n=1 Tax=Streptomyces prasinosporus TaxID=68256 RepID=A0ABP6U2E3_9ACTN
MDVSQLLVTLGLRVGAERAVASALSVLGPRRRGGLPADAPAHRAEPLHPRDPAQLARERAEREREAVLEASRQSRLLRAQRRRRLPPRRPDKA